jgi:hypothetical protein
MKFSESYARACALVVTKPPVWSNARSFKTLPAPSIIPVGPRWCEVRQTVFGWTTQKFPFSVKTAHALKIREPHVITVTGKAFYDIGHAPCRSFKPETIAERLRGVGNSSGDENGSDSMKYWETIADQLHAEGWSYGIAEHLTKHGLLSCVDAQRDGKHFIVKTEDLLTAFLSLERGRDGAKRG